MKKEVSDRIAQAFFENKPKKKKKNQGPVWILWTALLFCLFFIFLMSSLRKQANNKNTQVSPGSIIFEKHDSPYILNFDFTKNPSKKLSLNIDTGDIDLNQYTQLRFRVKLLDADSLGENVLKVCLVNSRQEIACVYVRKIGTRWTNILLNLSDFLKIHDWAHLKNLIFTLEEWNLESKKGELFIDEVEFCANAKT